MKHSIAWIGAAAVAAVVAVVVVAPSAGTARAAKAGSEVRIESWLKADTGATGTGLAATVKACFKLSGAFEDQGGAPTWSDATYTSTAQPAAKCDDWTPVGGAMFVPPTGADGKFTLYAVHTLTGQKGTIDITFAGWYYVTGNGHGEGTWVVSGGTGVYTNVKGEGTWSAELGATFPYIRHTETGTMWRT